MTPDHIRAQIIALRTQDMTTDDVANQLDISRNIVCKTWWLYHTGQRYQHLKPSANGSKAAHARVRVLPKPDPSPVTDLDNWEGVTDRNQRGAFQQALDKLERDNAVLIVEHDNDNHFPYHDENAQNMRMELRAILQPHLIVGGSDAIDAPGLSKYEKDPRLTSGRTLRRFRPYWEYHVQERYAVAPDAVKVWIDGNHCRRVWEYIMADENYDILYDDYVNTLTTGGVFFLGTGSHALSVIVADSLMVTHGTKATIHSAAGMLREYNYHYSILAGHSHRPDYYTTRTRYTVSATIGGCGCDLRPHYEKLKVYTKWQHGYSYALVDTRTSQVVTKHIPFLYDKHHIWAALDRDIIKLPRIATQEQAA